MPAAVAVLDLVNVNTWLAGSAAVTKRRKVERRIVEPFASERISVHPVGALMVALPRTLTDATIRSPGVTPDGTAIEIDVEAAATAELAPTNTTGVGVGDGVGAGVGLG